MTPRNLFCRYADERRAAAIPGYVLDGVDLLTRYTPIAPDLEGLVMFSELAESAIEDAIRDQIQYFSHLGRAFEWKVHAFDSPADLITRLRAHGFEPGDAEALMVYRVNEHASRAQISDVRIERVTSAAGIHDMAEVQAKVWNEELPWLGTWLHSLLPRAALFCAYRGATPVGTGWIEFPPGASFAELHGGAVLASERGRGLYSALFDVRVEEAKRRGAEFIAVDAAPMSRPILLRKGFTHVCDTVPFRKRCGEGRSADRCD
jgi:GNAT superfamily N-acetyltransferase